MEMEELVKGKKEAEKRAKFVRRKGKEEEEDRKSD